MPGPHFPSPPRAGDPKLSPLLSTTQFHVVIGSRAEEGQYNLNFHNCYNSVPGQEQPFDITVSGVEGGGLSGCPRVPHPKFSSLKSSQQHCEGGSLTTH